MIAIASLLAVLLMVARSRWVDRRLTPLIGRLLSRYTDVPVRDYAALLELEQGYSVLELAVEPRDWLAGRTLAELELRDEGVVVLASPAETAPGSACRTADAAHPRRRAAAGCLGPLRDPERAEVDRRVTGLPAAEEALDRRVHHDVLELGGIEQPVTAHRRVL